MRKRNRTLDIFNMSFLDIISCGFGAVIMLVLITKNIDTTGQANQDITEDLLKEFLSLKKQFQSIEQKINERDMENKTIAEQSKELLALEERLNQDIRQKELQEQKLQERLSGLSLVKQTLKKATISPKPKQQKRDTEVGGIPVDSDYVIFVIDTSGSMQEIWPRVSDEIVNALNIHPKVKGFQILNDLGKPLISGYEGKWIPDTPKRRKSALKIFELWGDMSNSSPIEGIETALKKYAKPNITTSIYVFGDDYTGSSYDQIIDSITNMNNAKLSGKRLAKIHGVGFISPNTTNRFAILMRELTHRNGGSFLALPR